MFNYLKPATPPALAAPLQGPRVYLRAPRLSDWRTWADLRAASRAFLEPWEPSWPEDPFTRAVFRGLLRRHARESRDGTGYGFFIFRRTEDSLLGGVTLSNLRRGPSAPARARRTSIVAVSAMPWLTTSEDSWL